MEVDSAEHESFWKGIAAGFLAGVTVAALLRYAPFARTIGGKIEQKFAALQKEHPLLADAMQTKPSAPEVAGEVSASSDTTLEAASAPSRGYPRSLDMGSAG